MSNNDINSLVDPKTVKKTPDPIGAIGSWFANQFGDSNIKEQAANQPQTQQPASSAASSTPAASTLSQLDPLAVQLFFTQAIAPMLQNLAGGLESQNKQFTDLAQQNLQHFQMPEQYKAIFGQMIPQQAQQQNDVIAALSGAAASGPALDELMQNVTAARTAAQKSYYEQLLGGASANPLLTQIPPA